jgi:hypothetical protein
MQLVYADPDAASTNASMPHWPAALAIFLSAELSALGIPELSTADQALHPSRQPKSPAIDSLSR